MDLGLRELSFKRLLATPRVRRMSRLRAAGTAIMFSVGSLVLSFCCPTEVEVSN